MQAVFAAQQALNSMDKGELSPGFKRLRRQADHSLPSSVEVKNKWSYTRILPPTCHHGVQRDSLKVSLNSEAIRAFYHSIVFISNGMTISAMLLRAFAKLRKYTMSFVMSVRPPVRLSVCMEQLASQWRDFHEI